MGGTSCHHPHFIVVFSLEKTIQLSSHDYMEPSISLWITIYHHWSSTIMKNLHRFSYFHHFGVPPWLWKPPCLWVPHIPAVMVEAAKHQSRPSRSGRSPTFLVNTERCRVVTCVDDCDMLGKWDDENIWKNYMYLNKSSWIISFLFGWTSTNPFDFREFHEFFIHTPGAAEEQSRCAGPSWTTSRRTVLEVGFMSRCCTEVSRRSCVSPVGSSEARGVGNSTPVSKASIFLKFSHFSGATANSHTSREFSHVSFFFCVWGGSSWTTKRHIFSMFIHS